MLDDFFIEFFNFEQKYRFLKKHVFYKRDHILACTHRTSGKFSESPYDADRHQRVKISF